MLEKIAKRFQKQKPEVRRYEKNLIYEADAVFEERVRSGMAKSGTPDTGEKRRARLFNLIQFFRWTIDLRGDAAECGCWKGFSSLCLCLYQRDEQPDFSGKNYHIFDSFEGLSKPAEADVITDEAVTGGKTRFGGSPGSYAARLDEVRSVLSEFPGITFHKGWIPQSFEGLPEAQYRFVHIDLDLHEPTRGAIEYFYPRLVPRGVILCDDYGCLRWSGAKRAFDEFCAQNKIRMLALSSGQGVIIKP